MTYRNIFLILLLSMSFACSGGTETNVKVTNAAGGSSAPAGVPASGVGTVGGTPIIDANIPSAGNVMPPVSRRQPTEIPGYGRPIMQYEPAAEDSQIASAMNKEGQVIESRIWKRHPLLLKVESTWLDPQNKALTITLRTGQIKNITTDKIPNLKLVSAGQILDLPGVRPQASGQPQGKSELKK